MAENNEEIIKIKIDATEGAKSVGELRKGIKELQTLALQVGESDRSFKRINQAIAEAKDKMDDLTDATKSLQGSGIERLNTSFGLLKDSLVNADPGKATLGFKALGTAIKAVPIFLLIEGIRLLVENFDEIISVGGIVGKVFGTIKETIDRVIQSFKDFGDNLGITNFKAKQALEDQKKISEEWRAIRKEIEEGEKKAAAEKKKRDEEEKEKREKAAEEEKKRQEEADKARRARNRQENDNINQQVKNFNELQKSEQNQLRIAEQNSNTRLQIATFDAEANKKLREQRVKDEEEAAKKEIELFKAREEAKAQILTGGATIFANIGNLLINDQKKLEKFNKAAALVQIGVDTAKALSSALVTSNAPTADNVLSGGIAGIAKYITLAAAITTNALRAKQILSKAGTSETATPASTVPSFGSISLPSTPTVGPTQRPNDFSLFSTGGVSSNVQQNGQRMGNEQMLVRAYVSEADITSTQKRLAAYRRASEL